MLRAATALTLMIIAGTAQSQIGGNCAAVVAPHAPAASATVLAPVAPEVVAPRHQLGASSSVLAQALDVSLSVDQVLYRIKLAGCTDVASVTPAPDPGAMPGSTAPSTLPASAPGLPPGAAPMPASTDPAAYQPRTEFDNKPWRFDMNQNGKSMTADEFTAWMESKGVRVVGRRPVAAVATEVEGVPAVDPEFTTDGGEPAPGGDGGDQ